MRLRSSAATAVAATAMALTASLALPATAAQATITSCQHGPTGSGDSWRAYSCSSTNPGPDRFRAIAYCVRENGSRTTAYGAWARPIGGVSVATCPVNYFASSGGWQGN